MFVILCLSETCGRRYFGRRYFGVHRNSIRVRSVMGMKNAKNYIDQQLVDSKIKTENQRSLSTHTTCN